MSHWGDMCKELRRYLLYRLGPAAGIPSSTDEAHHKSKMNEWAHRMRYTYFPKQELKFTHPEKKDVKEKKKDVKEKKKDVKEKKKDVKEKKKKGRKEKKKKKDVKEKKKRT